MRLRFLPLVLSAIVTAALPPAANAQPPTFFSTDFNSGTLHPELEDVAGAFGFSGGGNQTVSNGSGNRNYVRTVDTNYNTTDFVFRVDFNNTPASGYDGIVFIGLGNGVPSASNGREPDTALGYHIDPADFINDGTTTDPATGELYPNSVFAVRQNTDQTNTTYLTDLQRATFVGRLPGQGTYTAEIAKTGDTVRFSILDAVTGAVVIGSNGNPITGTRTLSEAAPFLDDTNSRLHFGTTQGNIAFDNFRVLAAATAPEPSALGLLAVGLFALARRIGRGR